MLQNKYFGFCLLLLLLFRTGLDCKMDGTEKGGARERNPEGAELVKGIGFMFVDGNVKPE